MNATASLTVGLTSASPTLNFTTSKMELDRELDVVLAVTLSAFSFYLMSVTIVYYIRHSQASLLWTNRICCLSAILLFFGTCWYQAEIQLQNRTDIFCHANTIVNVVRSIGNRTLVYVVLWIRLRNFYRTFAKISKARFDAFSYGLLITIILLSLIQIFTLVGLPNAAGEDGCKSESPTPFLQIFTPFVFVVVSLFQVRKINIADIFSFMLLNDMQL